MTVTISARDRCCGRGRRGEGAPRVVVEELAHRVSSCLPGPRRQFSRVPRTSSAARAPGRRPHHRQSRRRGAQAQRAVRRAVRASRRPRSAPPAGPGARGEPLGRRAGSSGICCVGVRRQHQPLHDRGAASHPGRPDDPRQHVLQRRGPAAELVLLDRGQRPGGLRAASSPMAAASAGAPGRAGRWSAPARRAAPAGPSRPSATCGLDLAAPPRPARGRRRGRRSARGSARLVGPARWLGHRAGRQVGAVVLGAGLAATATATCMVGAFTSSHVVLLSTSRLQRVARSCPGGTKKSLAPASRARDDLLLDAADRAHVAGAVDRAGAGDRRRRRSATRG